MVLLDGRKWGGGDFACLSQALWGSREEKLGLPGVFVELTGCRVGRAGCGGGPEGPYLLWASVSSCPQPAAPAGASSLRLGTAVNLHLYWRLLVPGPGRVEGGHRGQLSEKQEGRGLQPCPARRTGSGRWVGPAWPRNSGTEGSLGTRLALTACRSTLPATCQHQLGVGSAPRAWEKGQRPVPARHRAGRKHSRD